MPDFPTPVWGSFSGVRIKRNLLKGEALYLPMLSTSDLKYISSTGAIDSGRYNKHDLYLPCSQKTV
eukprot:8175522-Pyramimonas_sp.AAC.1